MMLRIYLLLFFLRFGYSEVVVTSTAFNGYVCPGNLVSYYCNATVPLANLRWQLDGEIIHVYFSDTTTFTRTNTDRNSVSAFYANVSSTESFSSELTFLTLPKKMFTVECVFGRDQDDVITEVVDEPQSVDINATKFITDKLLNVSWTESSSRFIQYYSVRVDRELYSEVRSTFVLIVVDQCDTNKKLEVEIIAVDRCNQTSNATIVMIDLPTTTESSVATTTEKSLAESIIKDVTDTHIIVIIVLILFLVLIIGILVVAIVLAIWYLINRIKNKPPKGKREDGKSEDTKSKDKSKGDKPVDEIKLDELGEEENCGTSYEPISHDPPETVNDDSGLATDQSQASGGQTNEAQNKSDLMKIEEYDVPGGTEAVPGGAKAVPSGNAT